MLPDMRRKTVPDASHGGNRHSAEARHVSVVHAASDERTEAIRNDAEKADPTQTEAGRAAEEGQARIHRLNSQRRAGDQKWSPAQPRL